MATSLVEPTRRSRQIPVATALRHCGICWVVTYVQSAPPCFGKGKNLPPLPLLNSYFSGSSLLAWQLCHYCPISKYCACLVASKTWAWTGGRISLTHHSLPLPVTNCVKLEQAHKSRAMTCWPTLGNNFRKLLPSPRKRLHQLLLKLHLPSITPSSTSPLRIRGTCA